MFFKRTLTSLFISCLFFSANNALIPTLQTLVVRYTPLEKLPLYERDVRPREEIPLKTIKLSPYQIIVLASLRYQQKPITSLSRRHSCPNFVNENQEIRYTPQPANDGVEGVFLRLTTFMNQPTHADQLRYLEQCKKHNAPVTMNHATLKRCLADYKELKKIIENREQGSLKKLSQTAISSIKKCPSSQNLTRKVTQDTPIAQAPIIPESFSSVLMPSSSSQKTTSRTYPSPIGREIPVIIIVAPPLVFTPVLSCIPEIAPLKCSVDQSSTTIYTEAQSQAPTKSGRDCQKEWIETYKKFNGSLDELAKDTSMSPDQIEERLIRIKNEAFVWLKKSCFAEKIKEFTDKVDNFIQTPERYTKLNDYLEYITHDTSMSLDNIKKALIMVKMMLQQTFEKGPQNPANKKSYALLMAQIKKLEYRKDVRKDTSKPPYQVDENLVQIDYEKLKKSLDELAKDTSMSPDQMYENLVRIQNEIYLLFGQCSQKALCTDLKKRSNALMQPLIPFVSLDYLANSTSLSIQSLELFKEEAQLKFKEGPQSSIYLSLIAKVDRLIAQAKWLKSINLEDVD